MTALATTPPEPGPAATPKSTPEPAPCPARPDVVTLGESMVTFLPTRPGPLAEVPSFVRGIGGAESNVACGLATAGHRVVWVSRVGADGFGRYLVDTVAGYGVDTSHVRHDPHRPTGVYFRTAGERALMPQAAAPVGPGEEGESTSGTAEVLYYRAGSAASAMARGTVPVDVLRSGRVLHLTGITAALSLGCRTLLRDLTGLTGPPDLTDRPDAADPAHRPLLSFDVNHRAGLWPPDDDPGTVLRALARRCDLVFVGDDEAYALWGVTGGPAAVRAVLPEPRTLVVKQGATGVTVFHRRADPATSHRLGAPHPAPPGRAHTSQDTVTFVPALRVTVVAAVGAGDAFAAGFLSATLRGLPVRDRARHGHLMAAAVLTAPGDLAAPPDRAHADRLAALDDAAWSALTLAPGWTDTASGAASPGGAPGPAGGTGREGGAA